MEQARARVIVVDDESVVRQFMRIALSDIGCDVETLSTCADGLERVRRNDFDVIFVDKNLPDGTGLQLCKALSGSDCKVALITGYANLNSAVEAMHYGVAEYFIKPLDLADLAARFTRMMNELRLERSNRALLQQLVQKCKELERVAARDAVTDLFNHTHFQRQLGAEVERCRDRRPFSIALVALDRFAAVNGRIGHERGDAVLRQVAALLITRGAGAGPRRSIRAPAALRPSSDVFDEQDQACRVGGDTFAVILPDVPQSVAAAKLERFRRRLAAERFEDDVPPLTTSIGIATYPSDGADKQSLVEAAQATLAQAKALGGDCMLCHQHATSGEKDEGELRAELGRVRALGGCLAQRRVRFDYQPILSLALGRPIGYEALCRPETPELPRIEDLLAIAARAGRLAELGQTLREVALRPLAQLKADHLLFLNVHPLEIAGGGWLDASPELYANASRIVLDITRAEAIVDLKAAREDLRALRAHGFRIALDDFGSGYQGFGALVALEPDFIKLDLAIVRDMTLGSRSSRLTRHLREFCDGEGIRTIAEGVETLAELEALQALGIDWMQGYLFARPGEPFADVTWPPRTQLAG